MPNTAALIGSGASGLYANDRVNEDMRNQANPSCAPWGVTSGLRMNT